jgi:hypothetical protein
MGMPPGLLVINQQRAKQLQGFARRARISLRKFILKM